MPLFPPVSQCSVNEMDTHSRGPLCAASVGPVLWFYRGKRNIRRTLLFPLSDTLFLASILHSCSAAVKDSRMQDGDICSRPVIALWEVSQKVVTMNVNQRPQWRSFFLKTKLKDEMQPLTFTILSLSQSSACYMEPAILYLRSPDRTSLYIHAQCVYLALIAFISSGYHDDTVGRFYTNT